MWVAFHIFSAKNIRILCIESSKTVNEMSLNKLVKLTMLWTTGPRLFETTWICRTLKNKIQLLIFMCSGIIINPLMPSGFYHLSFLDRYILSSRRDVRLHVCSSIMFCRSSCYQCKQCSLCRLWLILPMFILWDARHKWVVSRDLYKWSRDNESRLFTTCNPSQASEKSADQIAASHQSLHCLPLSQ